jgi:hypothetical protein
LLNKTLNGKPGVPCQTDLDNLNKVGVTSVGIVAMSNSVNWVDSFGSRDPVIGLFVPGSSDYQMFQQHYPPNETISQYVSGGIKAVSALPGSALWGNIYFNAKWVASLPTNYAAGLLMHELIHTLGATDTQAQAALFGANSSQVGAASDNITQKLTADCFTSH